MRVVLAVVALVVGIGFVIGAAKSCRPADSAAGGASPGAAPEASPAPARRSAGRAVPAGDSTLIELARTHLESPVRETWCGRYGVVTDMGTAALDAICGAPVWEMDAIYAARLGVELAHPPRGTVLLFARRSGYRAYVAADGRLPQGYAGFTVASRGMVVLPVERLTTAEILPTLAHELAHLAHRRAFGPDLAPWLAEGLADAIGDTATPEGFAPLAGFVGVEAMRDRLLAAYERGDAGPLDSMAGLSRLEFDRGTPSYDYAQAALLVRFLLQHPTLAPRFRAYLRDLTTLHSSPALPLDQALGTTWPELDAGLRTWLQGPGTDPEHPRD